MCDHLATNALVKTGTDVRWGGLGCSLCSRSCGVEIRSLCRPLEFFHANSGKPCLHEAEIVNDTRMRVFFFFFWWFSLNDTSLGLHGSMTVACSWAGTLTPSITGVGLALTPGWLFWEQLVWRRLVTCPGMYSAFHPMTAGLGRIKQRLIRSRIPWWLLQKENNLKSLQSHSQHKIWH